MKKAITFSGMMKRGKYPEVFEAIFSNLKKLGITFQASNLLLCDRISACPEIDFPHFAIRRVPPEESWRLAPIEHKDDGVFKQRWREEGNECRGIYYRGELIGYAWLSDRLMRVPELDYNKPLRENEVYLYNGVITKELRHRGFYGLFLIKLIKELIPEGKVILAATDLTNYKSRQTHEKAGFRRGATGYYLRVGPFLSHLYLRTFPGGETFRN